MKCYIYAADCYCEACGERLKETLPKPTNPDDETTFDSDVYPKGPFDDAGGESDTPQHCGSGQDCLSPTTIGGEKYGCFLENDLTDAGQKYVEEMHKDRPTAVTRFWIDYYNSNGYNIPAHKKPLTFVELGKIMLEQAGAEACQKGYGTTDPEAVGRYARQYNDINPDGTLN